MGLNHILQWSEDAVAQLERQCHVEVLRERSALEKRQGLQPVGVHPIGKVSSQRGADGLEDGLHLVSSRGEGVGVAVEHPQVGAQLRVCRVHVGGDQKLVQPVHVFVERRLVLGHRREDRAHRSDEVRVDDPCEQAHNDLEGALRVGDGEDVGGDGEDLCRGPSQSQKVLAGCSSTDVKLHILIAVKPVETTMFGTIWLDTLGSSFLVDNHKPSTCKPMNE
mmetsp:Transcript_14918/g.20594  ORF Transcript_14918/g.20594 Transcript_14918/m.20594 type:complete len:221 (-) Transcript_14918:200-862(-)